MFGDNTIGVWKIRIAAKIPSSGRGAMGYEVAGRGLATMHVQLPVFSTLQKLQHGVK